MVFVVKNQIKENAKKCEFLPITHTHTHTHLFFRC